MIDAEELTYQPLELVVTASDTRSAFGPPTHIATATVKVHIINVNDNAPVFEKQLYNTSLREGTAVGVEIARVAATDRDGDRLTYALLPGEGAHLFAINATTGSLRVAHVIDAETLGSLRLELHVTASDGPSTSGQPAHTAAATVLVQVIDVDEFAPTISFGLVGSGNPRTGGPQLQSTPIPVSVQRRTIALARTPQPTSAYAISPQSTRAPVNAQQLICVLSHSPTGTLITTITLRDEDKAPSDSSCVLNDTENFKLESRFMENDNINGKLFYLLNRSFEFISIVLFNVMLTIQVIMFVSIQYLG